MAKRVCWACGTPTHMTPVRGSQQIFEGGYDSSGIFRTSRKQAAFNCDQCNRLSIGEVEDSSEVHISEVLDFMEAEEYVSITWYPKAGTSRPFPDVPGHIAAAATEATYCLSLGAYRAAGSLARAVIEATAKDKGFTTGLLWAKIDAMEEARVIRPHIAEAAHEVRYLGNDMAHGDFIEPVSEEEATEAVELMAEVLNEIYQSPAKIQKVRDARLAKKEAAKAGD